MQIQRKLSVRQRAVSFLLAILMILMCIPSTLTSTIATGPMGGGLSGFNSGRNVLTNVSVSFYDSKFNAITEADSGELFYLSVQLAGNNVNEPFGKDNFRLEISDNNLLLPNFAGNGFKDNAVYNGFTLHYDEATGKRYLEYDIRNGDTKMIRLQAKFANGTTPDGLKETVKLIQTSSGKTISNTITANSNLAWNQNKSQDKNMLSGDAFKNGGSVTVNYTLSASSNNANKSKGAWFASGLHFVDTLKIPEGLNAQADLEKVLKATGFDYEIIKADGTTFDFWVYSKDESKEMDSVNITLPVTFTCDKPTDSITADVKIDNAVTVTVTGVGDEKEQNVGNSNVSLSVTRPSVPKANFVITKGADPASLVYDGMNAEEGKPERTADVTYTVTVQNTGDIAKDITLVEAPASGITIKKINVPEGMEATIDGVNSITIKNVPANSGKITFTVDATLTATGAGSFTNRIYDKDNENNSAYATTNVTKKQANISAWKTGWVGDNTNNKNYSAVGEEVHYSIVIENKGDLAKTVSVEDKLSEVEGVTWTDGSLVGVDISDDSNITTSKQIVAIDSDYSGEINVKANERITITFNGTVQNVTDTDDGKLPNKIKNVAIVDDVEKSDTLYKLTPNLSIDKTVDYGEGKVNLEKGVAGQKVTYTIKVKNENGATANNVVITEYLGNNITLARDGDNIKIKSSSLAEGKYTVDGDTITLTDSLAVGDEVTFEIEATIDATSHNGDTYTNTVGVKADDFPEKKTDEPAYAKEPPKNWTIEKELVSVKSDGDKDFSKATEDTELYLGDAVTYRVTITNEDKETIEHLYLYDSGRIFQFSNAEKLGNSKPIIVDSSDAELLARYKNEIEEDDDNKIEIITSYPASEGWMNFNTVFKNINLKPTESVTIEYRAYIGGNTGNAKWKNNYDNDIKGVTNKYNENSFTDGTNEYNVYNYVAVGEAYKADEYASWTIKGNYNAEDVVRTPLDINASELKLEKTADGNTKFELSDKTEQDIKDARFSYTLTATGSGNEYKDKEMIITDTLPDGMEYVDGSVKIWYTKNYNPGSKEVENPIVVKENGKLKITFNNEIVNFDGNNYGEYLDNIKVKYTLKFTDKKVAELAKMGNIDEALEFKNAATLTVVKGGKNGKNRVTPETSATVSVTKASPAPGFAKKAVASFAGTDMNAEDVQFSRVENGYITAGDSLIWDLVVYNGNGKSTNVADLKLDNATITDIIPGVYEYKEVISSKVYKLVNVGTDEQPKYDYSTGIEGTETADSIDALFTAPTAGKSNVTVGGYQNGTIALNGTLEANECVVIRVLTTIKDGQETEGVITNKGYLTTETEYSQNAVVAGEPKGKEIWNYANYNIVGLTTESWKTIHYENEGHTGDPHTDPKSDTGYSREATHNYVQGMQGEKVTYELHIKNTSPQNLESWTIIDRLPYVGDIGLVSGFERSSAFGVMMGKISKITVGGEKLDETNYEVSYSTDKTTVLTEYSKDWLKGTSGEMQWSSKQTDSTIDFRVAFNKDVIVKPTEEIIITFTGYVPAYVANTGEDNIAWNSFAYAYQCPSIFGDDYVMVAEPAKVGVWVEQPDKTITININKTSKTAGTFYFALFDTPDATGNRLSDVISITVSANEKGSTSMKVALAELDAKIEALKTEHNTSDEQANNFYVVEVDQYGKDLKGYKTTYGEQNTPQPISVNETKDVTVDVTNTANVGEITVNKTVTGKEFTGDTFYFALYTLNKEENCYVRYEDVPVKAITISETDKQETLTFTNVPADTEFYVLECNAKGVLEDSAEKAQGTYTSASGATYKVTGNTVPVKVDETVDITNDKQVDYSITVMKSLVLKDNNTNLTGTFTIGLFDNADGTGKPVETKTVAAGQEVVFKNLEAKTTYYVFEMIDGTVINNNIAHEFTLTNPKEKDDKNKNIQEDVNLWTSYDGNGVTLDEANNITSTTIVVTNTDRNLNQIEVTKIAINEALEGDNKFEAEHQITVGLYTLKYHQLTDEEGNVLTDEDGHTVIQYEDASKAENYEPVLNDDKKPITEKMVTDEKGKDSIIFNNLAKDVPYYVFELDADGNIVFDGNTVEVGKNVYVATYDKSSVVLDGNAPASLTITDTHSNDVTLQFSKQDVNGDLFKGATLFINGDGLANVSCSPAELTDDGITWTTDGENDLYVKGLEEGTYTLGEKDLEGFANVYVEFTVDKNGYITSIGDNSTQASMSATSLTVVNRSEITVSKKAITGDEEVAGAEINITRVESVSGITALNTDYISATYEDEENRIVENKLTFKANDSFSFVSKNTETVITGLPDGIYELREETAPDGFLSVEGRWTFEIKNGVVTEYTTEDEEEVKIPDDQIGLDEEIINKIVLKDKQSEITIGKYDITGKTELAGAKLVITATEEDVNFENVMVENALEDEEHKTVIEANTITWYSSDKAVAINGLPDGIYMLEEAGISFIVDDVIYDVLETTIEFEVKDGKIINASYTEDETEVKDTIDETKADYYLVDDTTIVVTDAVKVSEDNEVYISKKDATSSTGKELAGAKLIITRTDKDDVTLNDVTVKRGDDEIEVDDRTDNTITFTSGTDETVLVNLPAGTYTLEENTAPLGYAIATKVTFVIDEEGKVILNDKELKDKNVILTDKVIELTIDKVEIAGDDTKELAGAKLTITNTDGTSLEKVTVSGGATEVSKSEDNTSITFTSGEKATVLSKLPAGNYTLKEIVTPNDKVYQVAETISFTVGKNGKLSKVQDAYSYEEIENKDGKALSNITMLDTKDEVMISKIDADTHKGVKGALLAITKLDDENGVSDKITVWGRVTRTQIDSLANITEENKYTVYAIEDGVLKFYTNNVNIYIGGLPA
ncbi:MAG: DUF11 domain-containing protein, partial [Oscillospiraceae bacterium]|nr:DUF11 domain-containing protein [Oscillospiraceae bacterium]